MIDDMNVEPKEGDTTDTNQDTGDTASEGQTEENGTENQDQAA